MIAWWADRVRRPLVTLGVLQLLVGLAAVLIRPLFGSAPDMVRTLLQTLGENGAGLHAWEFVLVLGLTLVPTALFGAGFPLVTRALVRDGARLSAAVGRTYAIGMGGMITGLLIAGVFLISGDTLSVRSMIVVAGIACGTLGVWLVLAGRVERGAALVRPAIMPAIALLLIVVISMTFGHWDAAAMTSRPFLDAGQPSIRTITNIMDGADATVSVERLAADPDALTLTINGLPEDTSTPEGMLRANLFGHIPLLLHRNHKMVCVIGYGAGLTPSATACYALERIDCVSVSPDVTRMAEHFDEFTRGVRTDDERVHLVHAGGRVFLKGTDQTYDIIISRPSDLYLSNRGIHCTREYFQTARERLNDDGLFAIRLRGSRMSIAECRTVVRTLFNVFDHVALWELGGGDYALIASKKPCLVDLQRFAGLMQQPRMHMDLYRMAIRRPGVLLGRFITADKTLRDWAEDAAVCTDDNALVLFASPTGALAVDPRPLAGELVKLQRSVLDEFLLAGGPAVSAELRANVNAIVSARAARLAAAERDRLGDHMGALGVLVSSLEQCPTCMVAHAAVEGQIERVRTMLPQRIEDPEAVALVRRFLAVPPPRRGPLKGRTLDDTAKYFRTQAQRAAAEGRRIAALDLYRGAHDLDPRDLNDLYAMLAILETAGDDPAAQVARRRIAGDFARASRRAGAGGSFEKAAAHLREARALDPGNLDYAHALAEAYLLGEQNDQAATLLDEMMRVNPTDGVAFFLAGVVAARQGQHDTAVQRLARAIELGPVTPDDLADDDRLKSLVDHPGFQALLPRPTAGQPTSPG